MVKVKLRTLGHLIMETWNWGEGRDTLSTSMLYALFEWESIYWGILLSSTHRERVPGAAPPLDCMWLLKAITASLLSIPTLYVKSRMPPVSKIHITIISTTATAAGRLSINDCVTPRFVHLKWQFCNISVYWSTFLAANSAGIPHEKCKWNFKREKWNENTWQKHLFINFSFCHASFINIICHASNIACWLSGTSMNDWEDKEMCMCAWKQMDTEYTFRVLIQAAKELVKVSFIQFSLPRLCKQGFKHKG